MNGTAMHPMRDACDDASSASAVQEGAGGKKSKRKPVKAEAHATSKAEDGEARVAAERARQEKEAQLKVRMCSSSRALSLGHASIALTR